MPLVRKCAKCGLDVADLSATACPICGANLTVSLAPKKFVWVAAAIQFAAVTIFMVLFRFPKVVIVFFGAFILVGTLISAWIKQRPAAARRSQPIQLSRPILYRVLSVFIALGSIMFVSILLFGTVMFLNAWSRYQTYQGQPYHRADFVVVRTYFQRGSKGAVDAYASGTVDGQKEWMNLRPYLHFVPRNEDEVDENLPPGTSIPIYLIPGLKGRMRVELYSATPPGEGYHQTAMEVLSKAPLALLLTAGVLFVLIRSLKLCVRQDQSVSVLSNPQIEIGKIS
jgi:hypothetical protein